jgi:hypothetical protein
MGIYLRLCAFTAQKVYCLFFLFCLFPLSAIAQDDRLLFLPPYPVFERLIGDPREPQSYLAAQLNRSRFDGSIAAPIEFLQWTSNDAAKWGWGIETDTFIEVESPGYGPYSLTSLDYFLIFPARVSDWYLGSYFSETSGDFSNRLEYLHVSSQLGDGFFSSIQGFVYTRESLRFTTSFRPSDHFRFYAGVGYYTRLIPEGPPFFAHTGAEFYGPHFDFIFGTRGCGYFTYDLQVSQDLGGVLSQNFSVGFQWKWKNETHQAIRLAILYYDGQGEYGQFYRQNDDHWSLGLFFDP